MYGKKLLIYIVDYLLDKFFINIYNFLLCAGVEVLENMVFLSNATNFIAYFLKSMHYSAAKSANMVTNFMGTSFLLTIVGGFICDSFITRFTTFIFSCIIELLVKLFSTNLQNIEPNNLRA